MINGREFFGHAGAGAALAITPRLLLGVQPSEVRPISGRAVRAVVGPAITDHSMILRDGDQVICWSF